MPFESFSHSTKKKDEDEGSKTILFSDYLRGTIRPFPAPIQCFMLGAVAINQMECSRKQKRINRAVPSERSEAGKIRFCFWSPPKRISLKESSSGAQRWSWPERIFQPMIVKERPLISWWCSQAWDKILTLCHLEALGEGNYIYIYI